MITQPCGSVEARSEVAWRGEPWFRLYAAHFAGVISD
jgi:hypothetical protein